MPPYDNCSGSFYKAFTPKSLQRACMNFIWKYKKTLEYLKHFFHTFFSKDIYDSKRYISVRGPYKVKYKFI